MGKTQPTYQQLLEKLQTLEQENAQLRKNQKILNASPSYMAELNSAGKVLAVNEHMLNELEYQENEVLGHDFFETFIQEEERGKQKQLFTTQAQSNNIAVIVNRMLKKDGEPIPVQWHVSSCTEKECDSNSFVAIGLSLSNKIDKEDLADNQFIQLGKNINHYPGGSLILINKDLQIIFVDGIRFKQHNLNTQLLVNKHIKNAFTPEIYEANIPYIRDCFSGKSSEYSVHYEQIHYLNFTYPVVINKQIEYTLLISNDITEIEKKETALQRTLKEQSAILDNAPAFIIFKDNKNNILRISETVAQMTGLPKHEIEGKPSKEIYPDMADKYFEDDLEVMKSGKPKKGIIEPLPTVNGEQKWLMTDKIPYYDDNNEVAGIIVFSSDITKIKEAERSLIEAKEKAEESDFRLKLAVESGELGIWDLNLKDNSLQWNDRMYELYGIAKDKFTNNYEAWENGLHPDDKEQAKKAFNLAISGQQKFDTTFRVVHPNNTILHIKANGNVLNDIAGNPTRIIGINRDITAAVTHEVELIMAKEKAEEADHLKSAFLANMSHEIRTPMNGILGFTSLLKQPNLSEKQKEYYLNIIEVSGFRMLNTINDIIDISKIESGQVEVLNSEVNINTLLNEMFDFFLPEVQKRNIKLSFANKSDKQQIIINSDKAKLNSIFTNLIKNAVKYTPSGHIDFGYRLNEENAQSVITFFVNDTGIGIPENRQEAIFDRFVQADIDDKDAYEGSGLGLAITKAYVEMLGGKIWVVSETKKGSGFYFTLPYQSIQIEKPSTDKQDNEPYESHKKMKLLIVEDEEFAIEYLKIALHNFTTDILVAKTGMEAVELCKKNPDLAIILMDMRMPKMNGYEATRKIREFNKDVFIVAQTAYAQIGDREKVLDAGCNDYITKPINKNALLKIISSRF